MLVPYAGKDRKAIVTKDGKRPKIAKGHRAAGNNRTTIAVRFNTDVFEEISALAVATERSFAGEVRYLIALGIEADKKRSR